MFSGLMQKRQIIVNLPPSRPRKGMKKVERLCGDAYLLTKVEEGLRPCVAIKLLSDSPLERQASFLQTGGDRAGQMRYSRKGSLRRTQPSPTRCVCVYVCACVRACVGVCGCVCVCVCV